MSRRIAKDSVNYYFDLRVVIAVSSAILLYLVYFRDAFSALVQNWLSDGYSHGFLVVAISLWLIWRQGARFSSTTTSSAIFSAILLVVISVIGIAAHAASIQVLLQITIVPIIFASLILVFGWRELRRFVFPITFLFFAFPIWDIAKPLLQELTIRAVEVGLAVTSIPALITGNWITLPNGLFEVSSGCSGLHYFVVSLVLGSLLAHLSDMSAYRKILITTLFVVFSVLGNWVRVYLIILAGYLTDMQHFLVTVDHYYFGWLVFFVFMIAAFAMASWFRDEDHLFSDKAMRPENSRRSRQPLWLGMIASMCVLVGPVWGSLMLGTSASPITNSGQSTLLPADRWTVFANEDKSWSPEFANADQVALTTYKSDQGVVDFYSAHYFRSEQGKELIHYDNRPTGGREWMIVAKNNIEMADSFGESLRAVQAEVTSRQFGSRVVVYWYQIGNFQIANRWEAKLRRMYDLVVGPQHSSVVVFSAACIEKCSESKDLIIQFIQDNAAKNPWLVAEVERNARGREL